MKSNFTRIVVLLDRSGSMQSVHEATVTGLNEFINSQKGTPGDATIKIVQFDENMGHFTYDVIVDGNLKDVTGIGKEQFQPRGMTPLHDAMGRTINELGDELRRLPESERPDRVLVCIVTDGEENASREFDAAKVKELVEHQTSKYNWTFTYVGANHNAVLVGNTIGIDALRCMTFTADAGHTKAAFRSMGAYASRVRGSSYETMQKVGYTDEERADSKEDNA